MRATILSLLSLTFSLGVLANPPACLLGVVGQQDSPHDLSAICGDDAQDVQAALDNDCSRDTKSVAQEAFISSCSAAGSSVGEYTFFSSLKLEESSTQLATSSRPQPQPIPSLAALLTHSLHQPRH